MIWDSTVNALAANGAAAFSRAKFHAIDGAAHLPQIEQASLVDSVLLTFLRPH